MVKWGIIGPGKIAHKFAEALQHVEGAQLHAVASRSIDSATAFAQKYHVEKYYGSYEELVKDAQIDIVYIATPHAFHKDCTLLALRHNKPVVCEKPLAHKLADVMEMIGVAKEKKVFLMEAMWTRFLPPIHKAMELINQGQIGEVKKLVADFGFDSPYHEKGRLYDMALGGGSLMDVGVYPLFLALTILGKPSTIEASATLSSTGADKDCRIRLMYPNSEAELFSSIVQNTKREAAIIGTKGEIHFIAPWYHPTSIVWINDQGVSTTFDFGYIGNGFEAQIIEAMACVKNGKIESNKMPHAFSILQSEVLDRVCKLTNIVYP